jgi:hypothetical protein
LKLAHPSGLNDAFCIVVLNAFDYKSEFARIVLREWLGGGSIQLRMEILVILRNFNKTGLTDSTNDYKAWCLPLILENSLGKALDGSTERQFPQAV